MPRISEEAAITTLTGAEVLAVVDNPGVAGGTKKITTANAARQLALLAPIRMGAAVVTANQTGITAQVDLTGFAVTFTAIAGHTYEVSWLLQILQNTSASNPLVKLFDGAVDLGFVASFSAAAAQVDTKGGSREVSGLSAGSHTLKLRASVGAGTIDIQNSGVNGRFSVKDLGV